MKFCRVVGIRNRRQALYRFDKYDYTADELIRWNRGEIIVKQGNKVL